MFFSCVISEGERDNIFPLSCVNTKANASAKDLAISADSFVRQPSILLMAFDVPCLLAIKRYSGLLSPDANLSHM